MTTSNDNDDDDEDDDTTTMTTTIFLHNKLATLTQGTDLRKLSAAHCGGSTKPGPGAGVVVSP